MTEEEIRQYPLTVAQAIEAEWFSEFKLGMNMDGYWEEEI